MVIVARPFIILLISRSPFFFSLFSGLNKLNNFSSPRLLLFPQMHTNTPTHKHIHIDKSIQRHACSKKKKKKKKEIHKHTHTQTNLNGTKRQIGAYRNNRCLTGMIGAHGSCLIRARRSRLIEARGYGSCLIGAREIH